MADINLSPYTPELEAIQQRRKMAELLSQQSMQPMEMPQVAGARVSPYAGLAKMLQAYTGAQMQGQAQAEQKALADRYASESSSDMQGLLKGLTAPAQAAVPEGAPTYTPNIGQGDMADNARMMMRPERNEMGEIIQPNQPGAGNFGMTPGSPAQAARPAGELTAEGFGAMKTPAGQQQYMAQLLAQAAPKEGTVLPEGASYITKGGKVLIQGTGKEDFHVPKNEFDPLTGQTLTVAYSNKGNRKVIETKGAYTPDQWNSIPVAERARLAFDQYKFGNVSATDLLQAAQKNVSLAQELSKLGFDTGMMGGAAGAGVRLPNNAPMPLLPANGGQPQTSLLGNQPIPAVNNAVPSRQALPITPANVRPAIAPVSVASPAVATPAAAPVAAERPIIEQVTPKERQALLIAKPQATAAATGSLQNIDRLISTAQELSKSPGLEAITGKVGQYKIFDVSEKARGARALEENVLRQSGLIAIQAMRDASKTGGAVGNVTEKEWPILQQSLAALDAAQDGKQYRTALTNLQNQLLSSQDKIRNVYEQTYGPLTYKAAPYATQTYGPAATGLAPAPAGAVRPRGQ